MLTMPVLSAIDVTGAERKPRREPGEAGATERIARPAAKPHEEERRREEHDAVPRAKSLHVWSAMEDMGGRANRARRDAECANEGRARHDGATRLWIKATSAALFRERARPRRRPPGSSRDFLMSDEVPFVAL